MSTKRLTKIEKEKSYINQIRVTYCEMQGYTEYEYLENEFENGLKWIDVNQVTNKVKYSKSFWHWWQMTCAKIQEDNIQTKNHKVIYLKTLYPEKTVINKIIKELKLEAWKIY